MLSSTILLLILATFLIAATRGGILYLFVANIGVSLLFPQQREIAGIALDSSDLMFFTIAAGCAVSPQFAAPLRNRTIPHLRLWMLLGCLTSLSYIATEASSMGDPVRAAYQLYRYCWKPILYYPLAALLIQNATSRTEPLVAAIVAVGGVGSALYLGGFEIAEHFVKHKNYFGGALVAPAVLAAGLVLAQERLFSRAWIMATCAIVWVTLVVLGSRGAFVGAAFGAGLVVLGLLRHTVGRLRAARLAAGAAIVGVTILAAFPTLTTSQGVVLLAEMKEGSQVHNLQWRMTERWPHYIAMIKASPWMGTGQLHDARTFDAGAKGTHNGYLAVALLRGIPVCVLFFSIPLLNVARARRIYRNKAISGRERVLVLACGAAILGIMIHNLVDQTVVGAFTGQVFWTIAGVAGAAGVTAQRESVSRVSQTARVRARRMIGTGSGHLRAAPQRGRLP